MSLATHLYQSLTKEHGRRSVPELKPGETVRVHQKVKEGKKERVQIFEGVVIAVKHGTGLNGTFTVRRVASGGVTVEKVYPVHLPSIVRIDRVKQAKVRRAKLYYLRGRQGKATRFANEWLTNQSWQEEQAAELGEPTTEEAKEEPKEDAVEEDQTVSAPAEEVVSEEAPSEE